MFELLLHNKQLKKTEIKKLIHKLILNPQPYELKQILSIIFEHGIIDKKQIPQLLKTLFKINDLDSLSKIIELLFQNSTLLFNDQKIKNFLSIIHYTNIKQIYAAFLQMNIQDIFRSQHAQYYFDFLMQYDQPEIPMVILQSLNRIHRNDDLELFQQMSDQRYPVEYARTLVYLHHNGLVNCDNHSELERFSNGYGFDILLRFLLASKVLTREYVYAFAKCQNILLNHQLILLWDEVDADSIGGREVESIIEICNQEVSDQEKIKLIWQIISLSIPTLKKFCLPWILIPINNVNRSSSLTFITLMRQYQQSFAENSIYALISNFKSLIEQYAGDSIRQAKAQNQLLDIFFNYSNYYDKNTHMTPVQLIGLITLAFEDCYDLKGCLKDLIDILNDIHDELFNHDPQIKILAFFNKITLCLNNHHPNYEQFYCKKKFSSFRAHAIIDSEVSMFCEEHRVVDFQMKTYWQILRPKIEESFHIEFDDLYSKASIKQLVFRFDKRFINLASESIFSSFKAHQEMCFVHHPNKA